jgi:hypothetical protein
MVKRSLKLEGFFNEKIIKQEKHEIKKKKGQWRGDKGGLLKETGQGRVGFCN